MILLQESAASDWEGSIDWDNSAMSGGAVETDYDVACAAHDAKQYCIYRHERAMLVLPNETCQSVVTTLANGVIVLFEYDENRELIEQEVHALLQNGMPGLTFPFPIEDRLLRLLPASDDGNAEVYGYVEIPVHPGIWAVSLMEMANETVTILQPPG